MFAPHAGQALSGPATLGRTAVVHPLAAPPAWHANSSVGLDDRASDHLVEPITVAHAPLSSDSVTWVAAVAAVVALAVAYRELRRRPSDRAAGMGWSSPWSGVGLGIAGLTALLAALGRWFGVPAAVVSAGVVVGGAATGIVLGLVRMLRGRAVRSGGLSTSVEPFPPAHLPRQRSCHGSLYVDPATGLANRLQVSLSIAGMRCGPRSPGALLVIGVRRAEVTSDTVPAEVLREVAGRLRRATAPDDRGDERPEPDLAARWSATEFAVLTRSNLAQAYGLADRLTSVLSAPVPVSGGVVRLSVSVGLTGVAGADSTADVARRAQLALTRARQLGPNGIEWYDATVEALVARQVTLERELPEALRRGHFSLVYQPIMDLDRGRPLAVEALLRWRHPVLGTILPAEVLPLAEHTGRIADVDRWVLRQASAQLAAWRHEGRDLSMAINVSPRELRNAQFTDEVAKALAAHDLPPDRLVVEVAEAGIEEDSDLDERVATLRSMGVRTALDEFGAGIFSLAHLRRLPIDMVKIGQSFFADGSVAGAGGVGDRGSLIESMVGVGRRLGIDVVAQCVEAPAQLATVRTAGCRFGQGHLFARPQPAERTEAYLDGFGPGTDLTAR